MSDIAIPKFIFDEFTSNNHSIKKKQNQLAKKVVTIDDDKRTIDEIMKRQHELIAQYPSLENFWKV